MKKSQAAIGILTLAFTFFVCLAAFQIVRQPTFEKIEPFEGAWFLSLIAEEIDESRFHGEEFYKIDNKFVVVSEGIPDSWWDTMDARHGRIRPLTDSEFRNLNRDPKEENSVLKVTNLGRTPEGHPLFQVELIDYQWNSEDQLIEENNRDDLKFSAVKSFHEWRIIYLRPLAID